MALLGCGARNELLVESDAAAGGAGGGRADAGSTSASTGGGASASLAHLQASCAPNDGAAILLSVDGTTSCAPSTTPIGALQFLVWGSDLMGLRPSLGPGSTLTIGDGVSALAQGYRMVEVGSSAMPTPMTSGTLVFTIYLAAESATGSYDVTFSDGSTAQGSFDAVSCPQGATCG
jgi:hypothetical protein